MMSFIVGIGKCTAAQRAADASDCEEYCWSIFYWQHRIIVSNWKGEWRFAVVYNSHTMEWWCQTFAQFTWELFSLRFTDARNFYRLFSK